MHALYVLKILIQNKFRVNVMRNRIISFILYVHTIYNQSHFETANPVEGKQISEAENEQHPPH